MKIILSITLLILVLSGIYLLHGQKLKPTVSNLPTSIQSQESPSPAPKVSILATNLEIPWSLVFLPSGEILFTERPGRIRIIDKNGKLDPKPVFTVSDVKTIGEGGLLGITISPDFETNSRVFLYYTYDQNGPLNRVVSYKFDGQNFTDRKVLVENIRGAVFHNGGRIKFGPDGFLYVTSGDALNPSQAQDKNSNSGKILRMTEDGKVAPGNPFDNFIYSYGHRNPQGLAWDKNGQLWETEHGNNAHDEVNKIDPGKNYGWPTIQGHESAAGMVIPIINSENSTWAPSGAAILDNYLYFAGLRGTALYRIKITDQNPKLETFFKGEFGRIRDVIVGPNKLLYILTSNRDGRGAPSKDDDKILIINPALL